MKRQLLFHGKSLPTPPKTKESWITIRGTHVKLDEEGNIEKGPGNLKEEESKEKLPDYVGDPINVQYEVPQHLRENDVVLGLSDDQGRVGNSKVVYLEEID